MRPSVTIETAQPPTCGNDNESRNTAGSAEKSNKCSCESCGSLIVHIKHDEEGRQISPRHQTVFNRLYRHRLTKELHHRKLTAEQIEKEARECTYMPQTNSASSLNSIAHREQLVEEARQKFNQGVICVECLKKVEISTRTIVLDDERLMTQSLPPNDMPPQQITFLKKATPKGETRGRPPTPTRSRPPPPVNVATLEESRNDAVDQDKNPSPVEVNREEYASFADHPPREIIVKEKKKEKKKELNRFGFPSPSPTRKGKADVVQESRNDVSPASQKVSLPPRPPTPTIFSFDAVSQISTVGSNASEKKVPKMESLDSPMTPVLRNTEVAEEREQDGSESASTVSSGAIPLKRDSYVSIDVVEPATDDEPLAMEPKTPHSIPYDEKSYGKHEDDDESLSSDPKEEEREVSKDNEQTSASPLTSPNSESSMRETSILDRYNSFNGPVFVNVAPTDEKDSTEDWIGQMTDCVACDDKAATQQTNETDSAVDEEESAERKAADQAYVGCEVDGADIDCAVLMDDTGAEVTAESGKNEALEEKTDEQDEEPANDEPEQEPEQGKEQWLENATEWARYDKAAPPTPAESTSSITNDKTAPDNEKVVLAPSDEGFLDSNRKNGSKNNSADGSEPFFGTFTQTSAEKSRCSTVALTEASNASNHGNEYGTFQRGTSEGEMDEFLDRLTDCVTCWKLIPWPETDKKE